MPMQEFLASYAVQVDEDGARRLQEILEQNRAAGQALADVFASARTALAGLKRELSDASGMKHLLSGFLGSGYRIPGAGTAGGGFPGGGAGGVGVFSGLMGLGGSGNGFQQGLVRVGADLTEANAALEDFRIRLEAERPKISVNTGGITSAVSGTVASIRSMMGALRITVPVTAIPTVDTSKITVSNISGASGNLGASSVIRAYGQGGKVASPTLAMIGERGQSEYVIPAADEAHAVPLLRGLLSELSASARSAAISGFSQDPALRDSLAALSALARASFLPAGAASGKVVSSIQAPVTIHVTSSVTEPEAVAQSIYHTAQRSLLRTLEGVFAS